MESHGGGSSGGDCPSQLCCCWPAAASAAAPHRRRRRRPAKEQQTKKTKGDADDDDDDDGHAAAAADINANTIHNTNNNSNALGRTFRRNIFYAGEGNVYDFYDHLETIGVGSISTISKVRKKNVGGSARYPPPGTGRGWWGGGGWWLAGGGANNKKKKTGGGGGDGQVVVDLGSGVLVGANGNNGNTTSNGNNHRGGSGMSGTGTTGFFTAAGSIFFEQLLGRSGAQHNRTTRRDSADPNTDNAAGDDNDAGAGTGDELGSSIRFGRLDSRASGTSSSNGAPGYGRVRNDDKDLVYALKAIDLRVVNDDYLRELRNEIEVLKTLDHPNKNSRKLFSIVWRFKWAKSLSLKRRDCDLKELENWKPWISLLLILIQRINMISTSI